MSLEQMGTCGLSKRGSIPTMGGRGVGSQTVAEQSQLRQYGSCGGLEKNALDVERIQHFFCQQRLSQGC